jgi:hypothetical protein
MMSYLEGTVGVVVWIFVLGVGEESGAATMQGSKALKLQT